jgi:hypothetical protein
MLGDRLQYRTIGSQYPTISEEKLVLWSLQRCLPTRFALQNLQEIPAQIAHRAKKRASWLAGFVQIIP